MMMLQRVLGVALCLACAVWTGAANSSGISIPCDIANPKLGSPGRVKDESKVMWWTAPPEFDGVQYSIRTADTASPATDPTSYKADQWTEIYVRTLVQHKQFTGIVMYAENAQGMKVGEWMTQPGSPYQTVDAGAPNNCVTHTNADRKNYASYFRVKFTTGTGPVTIKCLVKFGLAFPVMFGRFIRPGTADLQLTEAAAETQFWFQGLPGQSCGDLCATIDPAQPMGVDLMKTNMVGSNKMQMYNEVKSWTGCFLPLLPGCGAHSPTAGSQGCFYHAASCAREEFVPLPPPERKDPCEGVPAWTPGTVFDVGMCGTHTVAGEKSKWCSLYYNTLEPGTNQYAWKENAKCKPPGGYPTPAPLPTPNPTPPRVAMPVSAGAKSANPYDGGRICACDAKIKVSATDQPTDPQGNPIGPTPRPTLPPCFDNNMDCPVWAGMGECDANHAFMTVNCRKSCKVCVGDLGGVSRGASASLVVPAIAAVLALLHF